MSNRYAGLCVGGPLSGQHIAIDNPYFLVDYVGNQIRTIRHDFWLDATTKITLTHRYSEVDKKFGLWVPEDQSLVETLRILCEPQYDRKMELRHLWGLIKSVMEKEGLSEQFKNFESIVLNPNRLIDQLK